MTDQLSGPHGQIYDAFTLIVSIIQKAQKEIILIDGYEKIYPYVTIDDLRLDMLPRLRIMAVNNSGGQKHPWADSSDAEMLKSAGLYGLDRVTGEKGYNMAAVLLLEKDDVIRDILPAYETDAILRRNDVDRYDDRETVQTNLIDSYDRPVYRGNF